MAKHMASITAMKRPPSGLLALLRKTEITKRFKEVFVILTYLTWIILSFQKAVYACLTGCVSITKNTCSLSQFILQLTLYSPRVTYRFYSLSNARQFYSPKGNPLGLKGLILYFTKPGFIKLLDHYQCQKNNHCLLISSPMLQLGPIGWTMTMMMMTTKCTGK